MYEELLSEPSQLSKRVLLRAFHKSEILSQLEFAEKLDEPQIGHDLTFYHVLYM